jgi:hypothetical protein
MKENRGRPSLNVEVKKKYIIEYEDSTWHYDLDKFANGPYLVEIKNPELDKLEKLYNKLEKLKKPKYHENGRKKRITKDSKKKVELAEKKYWKEHYRIFPDEKPKRRGRKKSRG